MNPEQIKAMSNDIPLATDQYIQDLLQRLGELEADKAELLTELIYSDTYLNPDGAQSKRNARLIQKHAAK